MAGAVRARHTVRLARCQIVGVAVLIALFARAPIVVRTSPVQVRLASVGCPNLGIGVGHWPAWLFYRHGVAHSGCSACAVFVARTARLHTAPVHRSCSGTARRARDRGYDDVRAQFRRQANTFIGCCRKGSCCAGVRDRPTLRLSGLPAGGRTCGGATPCATAQGMGFCMLALSFYVAGRNPAQCHPIRAHLLNVTTPDAASVTGVGFVNDLRTYAR